jgi:hypothetical protein
MSGNYGAGKTHLAHKLVGVGHTVALASPIRTIVFRMFLDEIFHATDQESKEKRVGKGKIQKVLKKDKISKVSKPVLDNFHVEIDGKDLTQITVRDILRLVGAAGRSYRKTYWIQQTCKLLEERMGVTVKGLAVDDVRFVNELEGLKKWAKKQGFEVIHYWVGEPPDDNYENKELFSLCDYTIDRRKNEKD